MRTNNKPLELSILRVLRFKYGVEIREMAEEMGVNRTQLGQIELMHWAVTETVKQKLAAYWDVTPEDLFDANGMAKKCDIFERHKLIA